jgi:hypothetical protein
MEVTVVVDACGVELRKSMEKLISEVRTQEWSGLEMVYEQHSGV